MRWATICRAGALAAWVSAAGAQADVVVTGAREALAGERLVGDLVVIDRARLAASLADSLEDLLRREAGAQLQRNGGPGANAGLSIRGAFSGQTLVLVDGVRIGSATTGGTEFEGLSLAGIERIEVLRGPGSSLYGADAVGGVVQIVTRRGKDPSAELRLAAGGLGAREASASAQGRYGDWDLAATLAGERLRGVSALRPGDVFGNFNPDRDGFERESLRAALGYSPSAQQRLGLVVHSSWHEAQYDAAEFAPPTFAPDPSPDFRNRLHLQSTALEHRGNWDGAWRSLARVATQSSDLRSGGRTTDRFRTERQQADAQLSWTPSADQQWTVAIDHLREQASSTSYAADASRDNWGLVLAHAGRIGQANMQAELRHDQSSIWGGVNTGRVGIGWPLAGGWRWRALAGTTFRAPSFNDLYFPGFGVASLQPERGRSVETGLEHRTETSRLAATVYRNEVRELIGYEPDRRRCPASREYDFGCARNIGRARMQGATVEAELRSGPWRSGITVELLDAKDRDSGARLVRRAAHQERLHLAWQQGPWSLAAEGLRVGARPEGGRLLPAYATLDLRAGWQFAPGWVAEAKLLNAGDRDIEPARDYRGLPRQAWLGLRWISS